MAAQQKLVVRFRLFSCGPGLPKPRDFPLECDIIEAQHADL